MYVYLQLKKKWWRPISLCCLWKQNKISRGVIFFFIGVVYYESIKYNITLFTFITWPGFFFPHLFVPPGHEREVLSCKIGATCSEVVKWRKQMARTHLLTSTSLFWGSTTIVLGEAQPLTSTQCNLCSVHLYYPWRNATHQEKSSHPSPQ
jgi:hypothetical protein